MEQPPHWREFSLDLELADDVSAADWLDDALRPWPPPYGDEPLRVASFEPDTHQAFARILQPARARGAREPSAGRASEPRALSLHRTARPDGAAVQVGGSQAAIDDVLGSPDLEAIAVTALTEMDPGPFE